MLKFRTIFALLGWFLCFACQNHDQATSDLLQDSTGSRIDSLANSYILDGKVAGFSIAVVVDKKVSYNKSFGYVDTLRKVPASNDHFFLMASVSKLFGASMIMKLVEEGVLDLEDKLSELLPAFPNKQQAEKIKLKHLISMSSGLKEYATEIDSVYLSTGKAPSDQDYFQFFKRNSLDYEPGFYYKYSNSGFVIMAMIVERVTGSSFESQIERIINKPTGFDVKLISDRFQDPKLSRYFEIIDNNLAYRPHWPWLKGDGGMTITTVELAQFPSKWMDGSIISKKSFEKMISPTLLDAGFYSEYALGTKNGEFEGVKMFGHSGGNKTTFSMMFYFPEVKTTIVVLVNTNNTPANARNIFAEVALIVLGKERPNFKKQMVVSEVLQSYVGTYLSPGDNPNKTVYITYSEEDQSLIYAFDKFSTRGQKMIALGDGEFWIAKWPFDRIWFVKNDDNEVVAMKEFYCGYISAIRGKLN